MKMTTAELAQFFEVDRRTVTNWRNSIPPCPSRLEGRVRVFDLADVVRWREARAAAEVRRTLAPADLEAAQARRMVALARMAELAQGKMEGQLVPIEDTARLVNANYAAVRALLLSLPQRWAPRLIGVKTIPEASELLGQAVVEVMSRISGEAGE